MPILVGITGGIGAGKTTVSRIFISLGIPVYYSDERAKQLMIQNEDLKSKIIEQLGPQAYENQSLNKSYIANIVFNNKEKLKALNSLVHPAVFRDYTIWLESHQNASYTLKEAALLFETGSYKDLDLVIFISAPEKVRINRVLLRDTFRTRKDIEEIIDKQLKDNQKRKLADLIIENGENDMVLPQALIVHNKILEKIKNI